MDKQTGTEGVFQMRLAYGLHIYLGTSWVSQKLKKTFLYACGTTMQNTGIR